MLLYSVISSVLKFVEGANSEIKLILSDAYDHAGTQRRLGVQDAVQEPSLASLS
jgi:hypothetical protein